MPSYAEGSIDQIARNEVTNEVGRIVSIAEVNGRLSVDAPSLKGTFAASASECEREVDQGVGRGSVCKWKRLLSLVLVVIE